MLDIFVFKSFLHREVQGDIIQFVPEAWEISRKRATTNAPERMTKRSLSPRRTKTPTLTSLQTQDSPPEIVVRSRVTQQEINQQEPASVRDAGDAGVKFCRSLSEVVREKRGFQK